MQPYGVDPAVAIGYRFASFAYEYTEHEAALYALGVGAAADPTDAAELRTVYELSGDGFAVLPTFATLFPSQMIRTLLGGDLPGLRFDPMMLLHGDQSVTLHGALPPRARLLCHPIITAIDDKGKHALVHIEVVCADASTEIPLATLEFGMFIRGIGGFGGERGASADEWTTDRAPDQVIEQTTLPQQALLYRLSGDPNPLHADPGLAALAGFDRPILHGLASFGFAGRAVVRACAGGDPARVTAIRARFAKPVFPGETLATAIWQEDTTAYFRTRIVERDEIALSHGVAVIG